MSRKREEFQHQKYIRVYVVSSAESIGSQKASESRDGGELPRTIRGAYSTEADRAGNVQNK